MARREPPDGSLLCRARITSEVHRVSPALPTVADLARHYQVSPV
jgi:hypothetical protein